jgi:peptidoglycan/LPS O-acetylase OafA/YrhL
MNSGEPWRLGHRPALDGLRGVAVLAVFAYHGVVLGAGDGGPVPALGVVGVGIFFTLSGFLITSLLLDDHERFGRIRFGRFWQRRARRLLPAVIVLTVAGLLLSLAVPGFVRPGSAVASLLYVQNWYTISGRPLDGLQHTWSLAIEEQFYLVWPLVVAGLARFGNRTIIGVALLGAAASCLWRASLWGHVDAWRIYVGTDTRADGLLIGCALAVAMREISRERTRPVLILAGFAILLPTARLDYWGYHVAAPLATSLGTALILFGVAQGPGWGPLSLRWLRWFGRRSYGLYLWQIPVLILIRRADLSAAGPLVLYVVASLVLTELSWRLVERRWLRERVDFHGGGSGTRSGINGDVGSRGIGAPVGPLVGVGSARS